jgi:hypothetical protein
VHASVNSTNSLPKPDQIVVTKIKKLEAGKLSPTDLKQALTRLKTQYEKRTKLSSYKGKVKTRVDATIALLEDRIKQIATSPQISVETPPPTTTTSSNTGTTTLWTAPVEVKPKIVPRLSSEDASDILASDVQISVQGSDSPVFYASVKFSAGRTYPAYRMFYVIPQDNGALLGAPTLESLWISNLKTGPKTLNTRGELLESQGAILSTGMQKALTTLNSKNIEQWVIIAKNIPASEVKNGDFLPYFEALSKQSFEKNAVGSSELIGGVETPVYTFSAYAVAISEDMSHMIVISYVQKRTGK